MLLEARMLKVLEQLTEMQEGIPMNPTSRTANVCWFQGSLGCGSTCRAACKDLFKGRAKILSKTGSLLCAVWPCKPLFRWRDSCIITDSSNIQICSTLFNFFHIANMWVAKSRGRAVSGLRSEQVHRMLDVAPDTCFQDLAKKVSVAASRGGEYPS